jgi:4a-hydroxytetrahydrobiopterin dehydratase
VLCLGRLVSGGLAPGSSGLPRPGSVRDARRRLWQTPGMAAPDRSRLLDDDEISDALTTLDGWERRDGELAKSFEFADFTEAFSFMTGVALIAERLFHHPEWSNVWSRVEIAITNHDAGGLTELDIEFCRRVDRLGGRSDG